MATCNIRNIAFDLGGVVLALSYENAIRKFEEIGLRDASRHLDARKLTMDECYYAWHGYVESVPQRNLDMLLQLRQQGYKVCLLSNTNPFMMQWACSPEFDGGSHPIDYYFDHLYLSYECKVMKPSPVIFQMMLEGQQASPEETLFIDDSFTPSVLKTTKTGFRLSRTISRFRIVREA